MVTPGTRTRTRATGQVVRTRAGGHAVVVRRFGTAGPLVVLVHGIGVSWRYFAPLVDTLAVDHRVLAVDLPGFGDSPRPDRPLAVEDHAAVVAELVRSEVGRLRADDDVAVEDDAAGPVLVGHSMGAQVVCAVAAANPRLVSRVVLAGPVVEPGARSVLRQAWRLLRDTRHEPWRANAVVLADYLRCGPRWYHAHLRPMLDYRLEAHLADVVDPVVLMRGGRDPVAPSDYLHRLGALPRSVDVVEVPGEGHVLMWRRPEVVAQWCRPLERDVVPDA